MSVPSAVRSAVGKGWDIMDTSPMRDVRVSARAIGDKAGPRSSDERFAGKIVAAPLIQDIAALIARSRRDLERGMPGEMEPALDRDTQVEVPVVG